MAIITRLAHAAGKLVWISPQTGGRIRNPHFLQSPERALGGFRPANLLMNPQWLGQLVLDPHDRGSMTSWDPEKSWRCAGRATRAVRHRHRKEDHSPFEQGPTRRRFGRGG
jgi:hypothetical protein